MKRFNVVISKADGGVEIYPMKEWLRQHPTENPSGLDPTTSTSHQLRNALRKLGWTVQEGDSEVRLIRPDGTGRLPDVANVIGEATALEDEQEADTQSETTFSLEYQLRDFIAQNMPTIPVNGRRLDLYVDTAGRDGIEYPSAVGPIDILARDQLGAFYVFELKRARSPDHAIGQLARYMGWVKETIGRDKEVFGVIVAKAISENLRYAVCAVPKVSLFEYEVKFHLHPAHDLARGTE